MCALLVREGPTSVTLLLAAEVAHETRDPYAQPWDVDDDAAVCSS